MTVIQFKPIQQTNNTRQQNTCMQFYSDSSDLQTPCDEFIANKTSSTISNKEIKLRGEALYKSALEKKHILEKKIFKAICKDYQYFEDEHKNPVTFEIDNLGRYVMVECDKKGNDTRRTTFTPQDGRIWSIQSEDGERIIFFNYSNNYTEVRKTTPARLFKKGQKEVFCYSNHKLCSYSRYEQKFLQEEKLTDRLTF